MADVTKKSTMGDASPVDDAGDSQDQLDHTGGAGGISRDVTEADEAYVARHTGQDVGQETPTQSGIGTTGTKRGSDSRRSG